MEDRIRVPDIDLDAVRRYRLDRLRSQMARGDVALCVVTSPLSLRYAVDFREYQLFQSRIPTYLLFVPVEGPVSLFGASNHDLDLVDEYRPTRLLNTFDGGLDRAAIDDRFSRTVRDHLVDCGFDPGSRVAVERLHTSTVSALAGSGVRVVDADPLIERARSIKSPGEIDCMRHSVTVAQRAIDLMRAALEPGITENELWAILHHTNIAHDGDWIDGRMLASGPRTNPWLQEATSRVIEAGELVGLDTDMIGPFGYCADISRTFLCGDGPPTPAQIDLYRHAHDEVHTNIDLIEPGLGFRELSMKAFPRRDEFRAHRYPCLAHGLGMSDEYPQIRYSEDWDDRGYDGVIEESMVLCVESFTGSEHGGEGVKLEQMVLVTAGGTELLSTYPFEVSLLGEG